MVEGTHCIFLWGYCRYVLFWFGLLLYQLPFIKMQHCRLPDKLCLSHGMCLYQVMMTLVFLNDVPNDTESIQKIDKCVIFASLKSESTW